MLPHLYRTDSSYYSTTRKKRAKSNKHDTLLKWKTAPRNVLIVKKIRDLSCTYDLMEVSLHLLAAKRQEKLTLFFQADTYSEIQRLSQQPKDDKLKEKAVELLSADHCAQLRVQSDDEIGNECHCIIVLGGDGTLLYLVSLFRDHQNVPPIVCFQRGSLGFLAPFQMKDYEKILTKILNTKQAPAIAIRMRLTARIWRHPDNMKDDDHEDYHSLQSPKSTESAKNRQKLQHHLQHHRSWSKEIISQNKINEDSDQDTMKLQ